MVVLPAGSCTTQNDLFLKALRTHVSCDAVHTFAELVRELCSEEDVSIGILKSL